MTGFLVFLGCALAYVAAGGLTARAYYVRKMDQGDTDGHSYTPSRERYVASEFAFNSAMFFICWWLAIPGYVGYRLYCKTVLAPTPKQRARLERERHVRLERELSDLQQQSDAIVHSSPDAQGVFIFACPIHGTGGCAHSEAFARHCATLQGIEPDDHGWG